MKRTIYLVLISFLTFHTVLLAQTSFPWFEAVNEQQMAQENVTSDCTIERSGFNTQTGFDEIIFESKPLFVYTHPQVKKYMRHQYLMETRAHTEKINENYFVILDYKINSERAKNNYGNLEKDGKIKVTLINGEHIYLMNIARDRGKVRKSKKSTSYTGTYTLDKDDIKALKKTSISTITVLWEEGVEEYEIQNIDLLKNQMNCID
jgi:hypothetical protein